VPPGAFLVAGLAGGFGFGVSAPGTTSTGIRRGQVTMLAHPRKSAPAQAGCYVCVLHAIGRAGQALPAGPITP